MQDMNAIIEDVLRHPRRLSSYGYLSTSEWLILCLGVGTKASIAKLPASYPTISDAWNRIGETGQRIVTESWGKRSWS